MRQGFFPFGVGGIKLDAGFFSVISLILLASFRLVSHNDAL